MADEHKTVFISYRRNVASFIARAIFLDLREHGYDVFMDVESIDSGDFNQIIFNQIEARAHFVLILTPGTLDNCVNPNDAVRKEIEYAMDKQRNIVPLLVNDFSFKGTEQYLTGQLTELPHFNGLNVPHDYFDAAMDRLRTRFLKQPTVGVVKPAPASDQPAVQHKIDEAAAQPAPTEEELTAEEYFIRGIARDTDDHKGKIADYSEAIRLNPQFTEAYNNRGWSYFNQGQLAQALADYDTALRLDPHYAHGYNNRGMLYYQQGNFDLALTDFDTAIQLNPQYHIYTNRGEAHFALGHYDQAMTDFRQANNLRPAYPDILADLSLGFYALTQKHEAKRLWRLLTGQDQHYRDADWVGKKFNWHPILIEAARKLIAEL